MAVPKKESWYVLLPVFLKYGFKLDKAIIADNFLLYNRKTEVLLPRKNHIAQIQISYFIKQSKIGHNKFLKCLETVRKEERERTARIQKMRENPTRP